MDNDDIYRGIPEIVANRFKAISDKYLKMIAKKLLAIGKVDARDLHTLSQLGMYSSDVTAIERELATLCGKTVDELNDVFDHVAELSLHAGDELAILRGMEENPLKYDMYLKQYVQSLASQTRETFLNISNTSVVGVRGYDLSGHVVYHTMSEAYKNAIDNAITLVTMGVSDYDSEIAKVIRQLGNSGLRVVDYASGRSRRLDAAVRMNVLDGMRQVYQGVQIQVGKQFGANGIELSAHATCAPDHLPFQGKQYSNEEFEHIQNNLERPFGAWNCRHAWWMILLGISEPAHSPEYLEELARLSNGKVTIDGKTMTRYEATQLLNKINNKIANLIDIITMAKAEGNDDLRRKMETRVTALRAQARHVKDTAGL